MSFTGSKFQLIIRQQPTRARVAGVKEKDRKPVDPQPIVQFQVIEQGTYLAQHYLQSPYYFMCCSLFDPLNDVPIPVPPSTALTGTLVSSLHRLKDEDNSEGGFFVFSDLSVKLEGSFRLKFTLFEMGEGSASHLASIISDRFTVSRPKDFLGMTEATSLSRLFADQGVKLKLRKKSRAGIKRPLQQLEEYPRPAPLRSPDYSSIQIPRNTSTGYPGAIAGVSQDYSYYTGPVKRQCVSLDYNNRGTYNDGRMYQIEAHPQNPAQPVNQPRAYITPTLQGHSGVRNYAMPDGIPPLAGVPEQL
ncbi:velvet factor-domain-containing protein [Aspergillus minisclerotigenes]|uniref:Velvet factor-domain-containing protein n=1 Tax=Aspergillus minisclerotigenes TaxID=656917 RepID=A0A5N6JF71_9EURO|nr:velvet factor-domain-containing protein [Aspergillus minisclerotigenes]